MATGPAHLLDIDGGAGNDQISLSLKSGTLVGGPGNDIFTVAPGSGTLFLSAGDGFDILSVPNGGAFGATVEVVDGWVYLGFKGNQNESASETDNFVFWRLGSGPEQVVIGGLTYSESDMTLLSNSKPHSYEMPTLTLEAPWYYGFVFDIGAYDPDGDALSHSILSVTGKGSDSSWWLSGSLLYTSFSHTEHYTFYTTVTLRASDGEFFHDYEFKIEWLPNPGGGYENYFAAQDAHPGRRGASGRPDSDFFLGHLPHVPPHPKFPTVMEPGPHIIDDIGSLFVI